MRSHSRRPEAPAATSPPLPLPWRSAEANVTRRCCRSEPPLLLPLPPPPLGSANALERTPAVRRVGRAAADACRKSKFRGVVRQRRAAARSRDGYRKDNALLLSPLVGGRSQHTYFVVFPWWVTTRRFRNAVHVHPGLGCSRRITCTVAGSGPRTLNPGVSEAASARHSRLSAMEVISNPKKESAMARFLFNGSREPALARTTLTRMVGARVALITSVVMIKRRAVRRTGPWGVAGEDRTKESERESEN